MPRTIQYRDLVPDAVDALADLEETIAGSSLDDGLVELVKLRASQINGCAYCVDMHTTNAEDLGVPNRKIAAVSAWEESPFFDRRERAALALAESVTRVAEGAPPESVFEEAYQCFDDDEIAMLVMTINAINSWNRLWVAFRSPDIEPIEEQ